MSISIKRYVEIQSGVGGAINVPQRELIGRFFTDNVRVPTDAVVEFDTPDDVSTYFGSTSEEAKRARFYFAFISKSSTSPTKVSFSRWAKTAAAARIIGLRNVASLDALAAITSGNFSLTVGGQTAVISSLNLTGSANYAAVAASLQTAIRAAAGTQFTTATVAYNPTSGGFDFTSSLTQTAPIALTVPGNLGAALGWTTGALYSPGADVQSVSAALDAAVAGSNNFGSFAFVQDLTVQENTEASNWNASQNIEYLFSASVTAADAASLAAAVLANAGTAVTLAPNADEYDEVLPMAVGAATNYDRRNSVVNFMFQVADLTPKVSSNADADLYDNLRVNYYGNTQTAGQQINFYQRGVLMGPNTAPLDMNTYFNEMWLKDAARSAVMGLLLAVPRVPANAEGRAMVLGVLAGPIDRALTNGVISIGKPLSPVQKVYLTQQTNDADAWHQVQNIGYWLDAVVTTFTGPSGGTEYRVDYVLVYSKDDAVRKVAGTHTLI